MHNDAVFSGTSRLIKGLFPKRHSEGPIPSEATMGSLDQKTVSISVGHRNDGALAT